MRAKPKPSKISKIKIGVGYSAIIFILSSGAQILPSLFRNKLSATNLPIEGLAIIAQLSQLQTLIVSIGTIGLVTGARLVFTRTSMSKVDLDAIQTWLVAVPALAVAGLAIAVSPFSDLVSIFVIGQSSYGNLVLMAIIGGAFSVSGQLAIAVAQGRGARQSVLVSSIFGAVSSSLAMVFLFSTEDLNWIAFSFVLGPAIQTLAQVVLTKELREGFRIPAKLPTLIRSELFKVGLASLALGGVASSADLLARNRLIDSAGLGEISAFQPTALIVFQFFSMVLSGISVSSLIHFKELDPASVAKKIRSNAKLFLLPIAALSFLFISWSSWLIELFFSKELVGVASDSLRFALTGEVIRACVWIIGASLLPMGKKKVWLAFGLSSVVLQLATTLLLIPFFGAIALGVGAIVANVLILLISYLYFRRLGVSLGSLVIFLPASLFGLQAITVSGVWQTSISEILAIFFFTGLIFTWLGVLVVEKLRLNPLQIVSIRGGLGNQLFGWAYGFSLSQRGMNVRFDFGRKFGREAVIQPLINSIGAVRLHKIFWRTGAVQRLAVRLGVMSLVLEGGNSTTEGKPLIVLHHGYWQSEAYFAHVSAEIRAALRLHFDLTDTVSDYSAIHIRRGDFLSVENSYTYGVFGRDYVKKVIEQPEFKVVQKIVIVTDDPAWAEQNLVFEAFDLTIQSTDLIDDFRTLAQARTLATGNSTFSWWAAYLSDAPVVFTPATWYQSPELDLNIKRLSMWKKVMVDFEVK